MSLFGVIWCKQSWNVLRSFRFLQLRWGSHFWWVSSHGRVRDSRGRVSLGSPRSGGYAGVNIRGEHYFVHRLVATTFIGPSSAERWQVNHIDRDRRNNRLANLEYVSPAENIRHSKLNCRTSMTRQGNAVAWRRLGENEWFRASTQAEAALTLGVSQSSLSRCCSGKSEQACGNGVTREIRWASQELQAGEMWKPAFLPGGTCPIPDLMVSNYGRIWSKSRRYSCGYTTCGSVTCHGYRVVKKGGKQMLVHRLVAATFLGHPDSPDLVVNHRDSDRANNHVQNLEYMTQSQNAIHSFRQGRVATGGGSKPVQARMTASAEPGPWLDFGTLQAASMHTGLSPFKINRLCQGHAVRDAHDARWEFRLREAEVLEGEEWRPVVLEGARVPRG
ncbi:unnamed protein product [Symbiodinium natans]|uniref:HNH nuclease domain-containing protein n=1 Tax=Symbiodinium natans TaxID=878477 RepID=A0A812PLF2_9DINO|nr:unnamed protein product [Symbiodinium natans]